MAYPLQSSSRYQSVTLDAGDTVIDLGAGAGINPFPVIAAEDLVVIRVRGGSEQLLALDVDYALGNLDKLPGARIFLSAPAQQDDRIIAIGARPVRRTSDLYDGQRFNDVTLNAEFDNLTVQQQELRRDADRAWKAEYGHAGGSITAGAAGQTLVFDEDGNVRPGADQSDIEAAQENAEQARLDRERAEEAAQQAQNYDPTLRYKSPTDLLASTRGAGGGGTRWLAGEFLYDEAASGPADLETAGGVPLYLRRDADLVVHSEAAGITAAETGAVKISAMLVKALAAGARTVKMAKGEWAPDGQIVWPVGLKELDWQGSRVDTNAVSAELVPLLDYVGGYTVLPALSSYASADRDFLQFSAAHGLEVGDVIALRNTTPSSLNTWWSRYYDGQVTRVREVVSTSMVRTADQIDPRGLAKIFPAATTEIIKFHKDSSGISLRNIDMNSETAWALARFQFATDIEVEAFKGICRNYGGLVLSKGAYGFIEADVVLNGPATGLNYPIALDSWSHSVLNNIRSFSPRHAVGMGGGDGIGAVPTRGNTLISPNLGSSENWALDFGHGNVIGNRVIGGTIQGILVGGGSNSVDCDTITTAYAPAAGNGNVSIIGGELHDFNHSIRARRVLVAGNGLMPNGTDPAPYGVINIGATSAMLSDKTVDGGVLNIEIGVLEARRWATTTAMLSRFRNQGFTGRWGVRMHIDQVVCPVEPQWFIADLISGSNPAVIDLGRGPDRVDPSSSPTHGWNIPSRGFVLPAMAAGGRLKAPLLIGSVEHAGASIPAGGIIGVSVAGFVNLTTRDVFSLGASGIIPAALTVTAKVSASSTVAIQVLNASAGSVTLPALTWYAYVEKRP